MVHKPIWSEGVLVSQHHFQQQDRYHEQLLRDRLRAAVRYDWGVTELEFDTAALATGEVRLLRFAAIWPDGASIDCGGPADVPCPPARSIDTAFAAASHVLEVFIGVPHDVGSEPLISRPDEGESDRRFLHGLRSVRDVNDGAHELTLEYARPNLRIFLGDEPQRGYSTIRVAELVRDGIGAAIIRDTYVPPVLRLAAAPFVQAGVHRVLTRAVARQRQLATERRRRQSGQVAFHAMDAQRFWLLHTLNGAIPLLTHLLDAERAHPEEAYLALSTLAGQLASFADDVDPTALPKFNYLSLGEVFESLFARVLSLLSVDLQPSYRDVELEHRSDGMYLGKLNAPLTHELLVAVKASMAEALLREHAPKVLKIADWGQIYDVVKQARHGVRIDVEWNPSAALPIQPGTCFFRIRKEGPFWKMVEKSLTIALYLPSEGEWSGASVSLCAVDPTHLT